MRNWLHQLWHHLLISADEVRTRSVRALQATGRGEKSPLCLAPLEPRVLFSATPVDPAVMESADESGMVATVELESASAASESTIESTTTLVEASPKEIVIIDPAVDGIDQLLDDLHASQRNLEVFVLDGEVDGVDQITAILDGRSDVATLHIVSHGSDGAVKLGNLWLDHENMAGYAGEFAAWQGAMTSAADILFYGCDLASNESGRGFIDSIGALTGADVSASADDTGNDSLGGDWEFEYSTGTIESALAFSLDFQQTWTHLLATSETHFFLTGNGVPEATLDTAMPSATAIPDYDSGRHAGAGTLLQKGGSGFAEGNAVKHQAWTTSSGNIDIDGPVKLTMWSAMKDFDSSKGATVNAYLIDIKSNGTDAQLIASDTITRGTWSPTGDWTEDTFDFGNITRSLANGRRLQVKIIVDGASDDDMLFAYDSVFHRSHLQVGMTTSNGDPSLAMGGSPLSYNEGDGAKEVDSGISLTDDDPNQQWATVQITGGFLSGEDTLVFSDALPGGVTLEYDAASGQMVFYGSASTADYESILKAVKYENSSQDPSETTRTVAFQVYDGQNLSSAVQTIDVIAVNDDPTVDPSASGTGFEDQNVVYTHAQMLALIGGGDVDNSSDELTVNISSVTNASFSKTGSGDATVYTFTLTQPQHSNGYDITFDYEVVDLELKTASGGPATISIQAVNDEPGLVVGADQNVDEDTGFHSVAGFASASPGGGGDESGQTLNYNVSNNNGSLFSVGPAIDSGGTLTYTLAADAFGTATVTVFVTDNGGTANGGDNTSSSLQFDINVSNANNDDAYVTTNTGVSVNEDATAFITNSELSAADADVPAASTLVYTVTSGPSLGQLELTTDPDSEITSFTQDDIDNNRLVYVHGGDEAPLADDFEFTVSDGIGSPSSTATFSITIASQNDAPIHSVPGSQATPQDTSLVFYSGNGNAITTSDDDAGSSSVEVTLTVTNGTLTLSPPPAVATATAGEFSAASPNNGIQSEARVASLPDGRFVVVWSGNGSGDSDGIYMAQFNADRTQINQIRINSNAAKALIQDSPTVAVNDSGRIVVAWQSDTQDGDTSGVYFRALNWDGTGDTGELPGNFYTAGKQDEPDVAIDAAGNIILVWTDSNALDGQNEGVFARRFNAAGTALDATEWQVNSNWSGKQRNASVAMTDTGEFVIAWEDSWFDGANYGIFAKRFDASANPLDAPGTPGEAEFQVNTFFDKEQSAPSIAMDASGNFVIVWQSKDQDGDDFGVYGQRYDAAGNKTGPTNFQVNSATAWSQANPSVTMDANGDFVVVWEHKTGEFAPKDIRFQQFDSSGGTVGTEQTANNPTTGEQNAPDVAMDDSGNFVIVWDGASPTDTDNGAIARQYGLPPSPITFSSGDGIEDTLMRFQGSLSEINAVLDGMVFRPTNGFNGTATLTIDTNDLGNSGAGGAKSDNDVVDILVGGQSPVADESAGGPYVTSEGGSITFDGSNSSDPNPGETALLTYQWDVLNDGSFEKTGINAAYDWTELLASGVNDDGTFDVALKVTDPGGLSHTKIFTFNVTNVAPTITVGGSGTATEDLLYSITLGATDPGDDTITEWHVDWGDGNFETFTTPFPATFDHTYARGGTYNVLVSATDEDGTWVQNKLYVPGYLGSGQVYVFNPNDGSQIDQFGSGGSFSSPLQTVLGPNGNLFATALGSGLIREFAPDGTDLGVFASGLNTPTGLAFDSSGNLWVGENTPKKLTQLDASGTEIQSLSVGFRATGMEFHANGKMYLVGYDTGELYEFDGTTATSIASGMINPEDVAIGSDGNIYVADRGNALIKVFDTAGSVVDSFAASDVYGLAFGPDGLLYVSSYTGTGISDANDRVMRYEDTGATWAYKDDFTHGGMSGVNLDGPTYMTFLPEHQVAVAYVADTPNITAASTDEHTQTSTGLVITRSSDDGDEVTHFKITGITGGTLYHNDGTTQIADGSFITVAEGAAGLKFTPSGDFNDLVGTATFDVQASLAANDSGLGGSMVAASISISEINDAPVRTAGSVNNLTVVEDSGFASLGLGGLAYGPGGGNDESSQTLTYNVTAVPSAALGSVYLADEITVVTTGTYTLAQIQGMKFKPVDQQNGGPVTFEWTVTDNGTTNSVADPQVLTESITINVDPVPDLPLIGGTGDGAINDTATVQPFASVTIDEHDGENVTTTVTLTAGDANGTFTAASLTASGFTKTGAGQYTLASTTPASAQAAIRQLVFDPTENQAASGATVMTTFTIAVDDGGPTQTDNTTDITVTSVNDAPTLTAGTLASTTEDNSNPPGATVSTIFSGTFSDIDASSSLDGIVVVGNAAGATTEGTWQYSSNGGTNWFDIGTVDDAGNGLAIAAGSLIRFIPVEDFNGTPTSLVVRGLDDSFAGLYSTTAGSENRQLVDTSTPTANSAFSNATTTLGTSVSSEPDAPEIGGTADASINDTATTQPLNTVTITDDDGDNVTVTVTLSGGDTGGAFTAASLSASGFTKTGAGEYSLASGSTAAAQAAIRQLVFDPTENQVAAGSTVITAFTISVSDGGAPVVNGDTDVTVTSVNDAPSIGPGVLPASAQNDFTPAGATISSMFDAGFSDVDVSASLSGIVVVGNTANPVTEGIWQYSSDGGTNWFNIGAVDDVGSGLAIAAASKVRFVPVLNFNGAPTSLDVRGLDDSYSGSFSTTAGTENRQFVDTSTPNANSPFSNPTTTLGTTITPNALPSIGGAASGQNVDDNQTRNPFSAVTITDTENDNLSTVVTLSSGDTNGSFTTASLIASGFVKTGAGEYTLALSSPAAAQTAIRQLVFDPTENQVAVGSTVATTFTITVDDGASVANSDTTVIATSINDAPTIGNGTVPASGEDNFTPPGETVANLVGGSFVDADASSNLSGMVVVGNSAAAVTEGRWQYSSDAGANWFDIGGVNDSGNALALSAATRVRFVPVGDYNGSPTALVVRGMDDTYSGLFSDTSAGETRRTIDTSTPTSTSPFSVGTTNVGTTITPANDQPTLADRAITVTADTPHVANNSLFVGASNDIDGDALTAAVVTPTANGTVTIALDGSFTYTPNAGFVGTDSFQWEAFDGTIASLAGTVTINVDAPFIITPPPVDPTPDPEPEPEPDPADEPTDEEEETTEVTPPPSDAPSISGGPKSTKQGTVDVLVKKIIEEEEIKKIGTDFVSLVAPETENNPVVEETQFAAPLRERADLRSTNPLDSVLSQIDFVMMSQSGEMWNKMDHQRKMVEAQIQGDLIVVGAAGAAASSFTVGVVAWAIRSGFLLSGLLAQMPAWQSFDALTIMQGLGGGRGETLEQMMDRRKKEISRGH